MKRTARLLQETGQPFLALGGDLSREGVAEEMVARTLAEFGRVDTLVNNAAALIRMRGWSISLRSCCRRWSTGTCGTRCAAARPVLPHMIERRYGRIVNIAGEAWRTGAPFHTLLAGVGKGSMVGLTVTLAGETIAQGITVNCAIRPAASRRPPTAIPIRRRRATAIRAGPAPA